MDIIIPANIKGHQSYTVQPQDTAVALGSGDVEVLATPKLLALMEEVSFKSVKSYLPDEYVSVGIEMNIKHLKSSIVGETITIESTFVKQEGRKLYFHVVAFSRQEMIGEGDCNRFIVNKNRFGR
ncbi:MAG: thioesterase family protein [Bacteroidales bacterium]